MSELFSCQAGATAEEVVARVGRVELLRCLTLSVAFRCSSMTLSPHAHDERLLASRPVVSSAGALNGRPLQQAATTAAGRSRLPRTGLSGSAAGAAVGSATPEPDPCRLRAAVRSGSVTGRACVRRREILFLSHVQRATFRACVAGRLLADRQAPVL
jgi:hypothetical protein